MRQSLILKTDKYARNMIFLPCKVCFFVLISNKKCVEGKMKKILTLAVLVFFAWNNNAATQSIDMVLDNDLNGVQKQSDTAENKEEGNSFFSFVTKPLSLLFSADDEVVSDDGKKETFLEKSLRQANEGSVDDQMNLGYMYLYGNNGVKQDFDKAFMYYKMAADQNDPIALNNLGSLYFSGIGTKTDVQQAMECFKKATELGNDSAAVNLAFIYLKGAHKNAQRNALAMKLFKQSADKGNYIAKFMLGYAYLKGFTVEKDYDMAFGLIKQAADKNSRLDEAQLVLGEMYINGYGTVQNFTNGITYIRAAVNQANTDAYMLLARLYMEGKVTQPNYVMAHALYNLASAQGIDGAAQKRDLIGQKLKLEMLIQAQNIANEFKPKPSELTNYVRQTFGYNIREYMDSNIETPVIKEDKTEKIKQNKGSSLI